jgi:small subunit ribosomal protein S1
MENRSHLRGIPLDDHEWWTTVDEGYWLALVEHGEIVTETIPPAPPQEVFYFLGLETETPPQDSQSKQSVEKDTTPQACWKAAHAALKRGENFRLRICGCNRGGLLVEWNGLQGFVPTSHLLESPPYQDARERMARLTSRVGESLTVRLIEANEEQQRLVFSERAALTADPASALSLESVKPGDTRSGTVTNLTSFGAFVDLGGVEGLVHISEISWDRIRHPSDVLQPGQQVKVRVVGVNPEEHKIALSLKRLNPDPWASVESRYHVGDVIQGTVTNVVSFGAFVRVEEGLEGLIHVSELAEGSFLHPRSVVREGDIVQARVLNVSQGEHRLGLSLRQARQPGTGASFEGQDQE